MFGPWEVGMRCLSCGAEWTETDPPKGFLELHERDRRKVADEFIESDHQHKCGLLGRGVARCTGMMRSIDSDEAMELAHEQVGRRR